MADGETPTNDHGYMRAQFEQIQANLCELKPVPGMLSHLVSTVQDVVAQVRTHAVTLYGEKAETGLVGRVERVEVKVNQIFAGVGLIGSAIILWFVAQLTGLITP